MAGEKYLIVNADDFGQSPGINRGIVQAHEQGIVTSASLMTRWLGAAEASLYAQEHPSLSLGLHLDLGEWICRAGSWVPLYTVVSLEDKRAVEREVSRQLDSFRSLMGRDPIHINSHQGLHMREPLRSVALELCQTLAVPLRNLCPEINYFTRFYGQTFDGMPLPAHLDVGWLIDNLAALPCGWTVLVCHPGDGNDLKTGYQTERAEELKILCDPRLRSAIDTLGITLCSFHEWSYLKNSLGQPNNGSNTV